MLLLRAGAVEDSAPKSIPANDSGIAAGEGGAAVGGGRRRGGPRGKVARESNGKVARRAEGARGAGATMARQPEGKAARRAVCACEGNNARQNEHLLRRQVDRSLMVRGHFFVDKMACLLQVSFY